MATRISRKGLRSQMNEEKEEQSSWSSTSRQTCRVTPGRVTQLQFCDTSARHKVTKNKEDCLTELRENVKEDCLTELRENVSLIYFFIVIFFAANRVRQRC